MRGVSACVGVVGSGMPSAAVVALAVSVASASSFGRMSNVFACCRMWKQLWQ